MESEPKKRMKERKKERETGGYRIRLGKTMLRHLRSLAPTSSDQATVDHLRIMLR